MRRQHSTVGVGCPCATCHWKNTGIAIRGGAECEFAYVFGRRKDDVFLKLQELLAPFGITKFYTDGWGAYERHLAAEQHQVGKEHTQKIESKHINLRTRIKRLVRRTLCFSKTERMHDLVIGLFINRYEFGQPV
jgi:insertion element IS1 protein InsB